MSRSNCSRCRICSLLNRFDIFWYGKSGYHLQFQFQLWVLHLSCCLGTAIVLLTVLIWSAYFYFFGLCIRNTLAWSVGIICETVELIVFNCVIIFVANVIVLILPILLASQDLVFSEADDNYASILWRNPSIFFVMIISGNCAPALCRNRSKIMFFCNDGNFFWDVILCIWPTSCLYHVEYLRWFESDTDLNFLLIYNLASTGCTMLQQTSRKVLILCMTAHFLFLFQNIQHFDSLVGLFYHVPLYPIFISIFVPNPFICFFKTA